MRSASTAHACLELAARTFFAQRDTITPLLLAAASAAANILLAALLMGRWATVGWRWRTRSQ